MRILFINYEFPPIGGGGANANARIFEQYARNEDLDVDLVTSGLGSADEVSNFSGNIRIHRLSVRKKALHVWSQREILTYLWRAHAYIRRLYRKHDYDVCHAFFGFPSGYLAYLRRSRTPYVVSLRGSDVPGFNVRFSKQYIVLKPIFRRIWNNAGYLVANSIGLRDLAHQFMPEIEIDVIPNGVDTDEFHPIAISNGGESVQILCVSRLIERKGVQHLIEAMPAIVDKIQTVKLTVIGEGDYFERLIQRSKELGIHEHVDFRGYVPHEDLSSEYHSADVYVQPSFYEGMSNTILEAMASGLPIVVSGRGGDDELYRDNCEIVSHGDSQALANAIIGVALDKARARSMGARSREIASEFSWSAVAQSYLHAYDTLLKRDSRRK